MSSYIKGIVDDEKALDEIARKAFDNVDKDHSGKIDE